jgi:hypothetical protein
MILTKLFYCSRFSVLLLNRMVKSATQGHSQKPLLPFLQRRSPDFLHSKELPKVPTIGPDGKEYDTYFYNPAEVAGGVETVRQFCEQDGRTTGEILLTYFHFFAFEFDWRRQVVSIIDGSPVLKEEKARNHSWRRHARLSIEDPFEVGYDVGHVLREETARRLRSELARGYFILAGGTGKTGVEAIQQLLETYEPVEPEAKNSKEEAVNGEMRTAAMAQKNSKRTKSKKSTPSRKLDDSKNSGTSGRGRTSGRSHNNKKRQGNPKANVEHR